MVILVLSGPSFQLDSINYYVPYARAILDHGRAFAPIAWGAEATPLFVFRPPGYPLFLAGAMLLSPTGYATIAVIGQSLLDGFVICLMYVVAERLFSSWRAAIVAVAIYAGSTSLLWDASILSDSLYASLWNIVIFALLGRFLGYWRLGFVRSLGLGLLWGASLWVRDVGIYFTVLPILLFALIGARERAAWRRSVAQASAFLAVVSLMAGGLVALNLYRTGEAFYSITGLENWLRPVFDMARVTDARPFADDGPISAAVRATGANYDFESQLRFIEVLHQRCGCTPTQMQTAFRAKYVATIAEHPVAFARVVVRSFNYFALGELVADPLATINQFLELGVGKANWRIPGFSLRNLIELRRGFSPAMLVLMVLSLLGEIVSAVAFTGYLLGAPYLVARAARRRLITTQEIAVAFLWFSFVGVSFAFSLVHYEARHALPMLPAAAIGLVYVGREWLKATLSLRLATEYR